MLLLTQDFNFGVNFDPRRIREPPSILNRPIQPAGDEEAPAPPDSGLLSVRSEDDLLRAPDEIQMMNLIND